MKHRSMQSNTWQQWAMRMSFHYALILLSVFPIYFNAEKYEDITSAKYSFFLTVTLLCLALSMLRWLTALLWRETRLCPKQPKLKTITITQAFLLAFLLVVVISTLCSPYPESVWIGGARYGGALTLLLYGANFFMIARHGTYRRAIAWGSTLCLSVFSLVGILQYFGCDVLQLYPPDSDFGSSLFASFIGNIDFCSAYICIALPLLMAFFTATRKQVFLE